MNCCICLEPIEQTDHKWKCKNCLQIIHKNCIQHWLQTCPLCRTSIINNHNTNNHNTNDTNNCITHCCCIFCIFALICPTH